MFQKETYPMSFEPQRFFLGLIDLFSILMPGALVAYLGQDLIAWVILGQNVFSFADTESGLVFLFASYLLGHFAFLLGALLDIAYDALRSCTDLGQIERRLAKGKPRSGLGLRWLAKKFFGRQPDSAVIQALRLKVRALSALSPSAAASINTFQWSKALLSKEHPEGLAAVQRFEADSKFFRSFTIVLLVLAVVYGLQLKGLRALACLVLLLPALWRYVDQRFKSTQQAYWFVITLAAKSPPAAEVVPTRDDGLTHAGGVVFRKRGKSIEWLLVQATKDRTHWVLPKGHIEIGEDPRCTAVREVREETGHWVRAVRWIDDVEIPTGSDPARARFYLMQADDVGEPGIRDDRWPAEERQHAWLSLEAAQKRAEFHETRSLLEKAEGLRQGMG